MLRSYSRWRGWNWTQFLILHQGNRLAAPITQKKKKIARKMHQTWVYKSSTTFCFFIVTREERKIQTRQRVSLLAQKAPRESLFRCCCFLAVEVLLSRSTTYCNYRVFLQFFSRAKTSSFNSLIWVKSLKMTKWSSALKFAKSRRIPCFPDCM